jgi:hypothetical protein
MVLKGGLVEVDLLLCAWLDKKLAIWIAESAVAIETMLVLHPPLGASHPSIL